MTTSLEAKGASKDGSLRQEIASRLRGELAMKLERVSQTKIAESIGVTQQQLSARLTGSVPFKADEIVLVCNRADVDLVYVMTGKRGEVTVKYSSRSGRLLGKNHKSAWPHRMMVIHPNGVGAQRD